MSHNIIVEAGKSIRLPTKGKYCDQDIVVTATGGEVVEPIIEALSITKNGTYTAQDGVHGYSPVVVDVPIPEGYVLPSGTKEITGNGTHDVTEYASVNVNVEASGGSDDMAGSLASRTITDFYSDSCTEIGDYSFRGCKSLKTLVAPNAKRVGEYALYQCNNLRSITLPSVTTVASNSFRDAQYLEFIDLPKVTAIASNTFYGCRGLKTLILRNSTLVPLNSTSAFTTCYRILGTVNSGFNPTGEKIGFIYVPKSLLSEYASAANWSSASLVTQIRAIEDYPDICG